MGEMDLDDVVLSWSVPEITDGDLYRDKVEIIPCNFKSLDHYFTSYRLPLIEETRSDLCSCLELIREAPSSKILSMEVAGKSGSYFMDVDFWDNEAGFSTEAYAARNGDIFVLSSMKPEAAEDLNRHGVTHCLAMVTEVSMDDEYQKDFRVKVAKDIGSEEDLNKLKHAIFLNNITTNMRIWKALTFDTHMNKNFTVIKSLLAPTKLVEDVCGICVKQDGGCLDSFTEQILSIKLNQSQVDAIESVILAVRCRHVNLMKLIWGPSGTGKTKTVSTLLWVLACLKCRTLTCAPTNVAVVGVCTRFLQNLKDFNVHSDDNCLPVPLGDILLFGIRSNMDMTNDLQDVFLDFRVDELVECFSSLSGWKYKIGSMVSFFEDCASRYDMFLEDDGKIDPVCFLDFIKKQFHATAIALERCIMNLWVHLPGSCFSRDSAINISTLLNMLEKFGALLCDVELTDEGLKRCLGCLSTENYVCPQPISSVEKELDGARSTCLKLLKDLLCSLNLPTGVDKNWVQSYCICNATLIFSTVSSSYRLHHMEIVPIDVLIVDEAAQVRECEFVIPLRLHWVKHVVLVGDDCQLSAMVKSKVCKEVRFGTSLYGRLAMLKFENHLVNIQYRMNPCISLFPNAQFYEKKILVGPNEKKILDAPRSTAHSAEEKSATSQVLIEFSNLYFEFTMDRNDIISSAVSVALGSKGITELDCYYSCQLNYYSGIEIIKSTRIRTGSILHVHPRVRGGSKKKRSYHVELDRHINLLKSKSQQLWFERVEIPYDLWWGGVPYEVQLALDSRRTLTLIVDCLERVHETGDCLNGSFPLEHIFYNTKLGVMEIISTDVTVSGITPVGLFNDYRKVGQLIDKYFTYIRSIADGTCHYPMFVQAFLNKIQCIPAKPELCGNLVGRAALTRPLCAMSSAQRLNLFTLVIIYAKNNATFEDALDKIVDCWPEDFRTPSPIRIPKEFQARYDFTHPDGTKKQYAPTLLSHADYGRCMISHSKYTGKVLDAALYSKWENLMVNIQEAVVCVSVDGKPSPEKVPDVPSQSAERVDKLIYMPSSSDVDPREIIGLA